MCQMTHAQSVHVNCISSIVFYNKNVPEKQRYLCQKVPKSTAISRFHKTKRFQHIVPNLSYAQVLAKGSNQNFTVSLDKPFQHIVTPLSKAKVKKGLNPHFKSPCKFGEVCKNFDKRTTSVQNTLSCTKTLQIPSSKRSVTECGQWFGRNKYCNKTRHFKVQ